MKKLTRWLAFLLAATMLFTLTACSSGEDEADDEDEFVVDTSVEDLYLATAGIASDYVMFTVDGIEVTAGHFLYWLAYNIAYLEYYYYYYYDIELDLSEDSDLTAALIEDARNAAALTVLTVYRTQELGYTLDEDSLQELDDTIAATAESYGGEEEFQEALRTLGLNEEVYYLINASSYYYELLKMEMYDGHPTEEEANAYIDEEDILYAKHILILTVDSDYEALSDEESAERLALAESILEQLQNSEDLEADFDALMNEYSEDTGLSTYPDGYLFTADEMVSEFEEATRELEYGEVSGIVEHVGEDGESYSGYHIILRLDPFDSPDFAEQWQDAQMETLLYGWRDDAEYIYSDAYNDLDVVTFYARFAAYQEAFTAEAEEEESSDSSETNS